MSEILAGKIPEEEIKVEKITIPECCKVCGHAKNLYCRHYCKPINQVVTCMKLAVNKINKW